MPNKPKLALFALLCFCLANCSDKPPDVFVFKGLKQRLHIDPITKHLALTPSPTCELKIQEPECGYGVSILTGREVYVGEGPSHLFNGKTWSTLKDQSVYVPVAESYAPLESYIIDMCYRNNCDDQVDAIKVKLDSVGDIGVLFP